MERLKPLDAQFVDAENEDRQASFAIASIAIFEGPAPSYDEFYGSIKGRLALVPIYRRKLREVPLRLGRPSGWTIRTSTLGTTSGRLRCLRQAATSSSPT